MGAGASKGGHNNRTSGRIHDEVDGIGKSITAIDDNGDGLTDIDIQISELKGLVGDEQMPVVNKMFNDAKCIMPTAQILSAILDLKVVLLAVNGHAVLTTVASSLQLASDMAPAVVMSVGLALVSVGKHLPYIGVACAVVSGIIYTFKLSNDLDDIVQNVTLWLASVQDWLQLIATKVEVSVAASTLPLFEGLQESLLLLSSHVKEYLQKWRLTKMLCSTSFADDMKRAKTAVLELKEALRDYLDAESQIKQEKCLESMSSLLFNTNERLTSIETQQQKIIDLLEAQAIAIQEKTVEEEKLNLNTKHNRFLTIQEEESILFSSIQKAAGISIHDGGEEIPIPFVPFKMVIESFFYNGQIMPSEQKRGLKLLFLEDRGTMLSLSSSEVTVTKANWIRFYRYWKSSNLDLEELLVKFSEENPTNATIALNTVKNAMTCATGLNSISEATATASNAYHLVKGHSLQTVQDLREKAVTGGSSLLSKYYSSTSSPETKGSLGSITSGLTSGFTSGLTSGFGGLLPLSGSEKCPASATSEKEDDKM